jgi:hypothetical protein
MVERMWYSVKEHKKKLHLAHAWYTERIARPGEKALYASVARR